MCGFSGMEVIWEVVIMMSAFLIISIVAAIVIFVLSGLCVWFENNF